MPIPLGDPFTIITGVALTFMIMAAALLYSTVGHAGASGYLAAMALFGVSPALMKPSALVLNILVATIATVKFYRAGCFSWSLFWPFALSSVPSAFVGGSLPLPGSVYKTLMGLVLLYAAYRLAFMMQATASTTIKSPPLSAALTAGIGIGLLSGLIGIGGGIFLSPLLMFMGWAETRTVSGVSALFILVNSLSGLLGHVWSIALLPTPIRVWAVAAAVGGWVGAEYGSRRLDNLKIRQLLAVALVIAGLKMICVG